MDEQCAEQAARIRQSPFFDADWYLATYADVAEAGLEPALHYLVHGAAEGRDPGPAFSTAGYSEAWPEVAGGAVNPLLHLGGLLEREAADDRALLADSALFDGEWYRRAYPDVAAAGVEPLDHYLGPGGAQERRDPGPLFSTAAYLALRPDVAAAGVNPLLHFLRRGIIDSGISLADVRPPTAPAPARRRKLGPKAVFVAHELQVGGAPKLLQSLAAWFQRATDYDVHVVAMAGGPLREEIERFAPVHVVGHAAVTEAQVPALREAVRAFLGDEPAFTFVNSAAAGDYCRIDPFDAPTFGYVHELPEVLALYRDQFEALARRARHLFCGAAAVEQAIAAGWPELSPRLSVRPSFITRPEVATPLSAADKAERRREIGWNPARRLVAGCGWAHWRKQPLLFVRMAAELVARGREADFVWIGDGPDLPEMHRVAEALGIADRLHLPGHRSDLRRLLAAADVFALPSSEDPFPLVVLEAGVLSAPPVVFREATGLGELIEPAESAAGGIAVPLGDERAFADAVDRLLGDAPLRAAAAAAIRERVLAGFLDDRACMEILIAVRDKAGLAPRVSVVLPKMDPARLRERVDGIAGQTFRDIELLLLDPTGQAAATAECAEARAVDGGAAAEGFCVWEAGIHAARGDHIWLADPSDMPTPTFLERALAAFAPSGVRLVHGRAVAVGAGDTFAELPPASCVMPAGRVVADRLGRANPIPSPGAVLVRRAAAESAIAVARGFRAVGDWVFYLAAAYGGRVAYADDALDYVRARDTRGEAADRLREMADAGALIRALYGPDADREAGFRRHLEEEAQRLGVTAPLAEGRLPEGFRPPAPGLFYGIGDLGGGGAQVYAMRLLNAWAALPAPAVLFVARETDRPGSRAKLSPLVPVVGPEDVAAEGGLGPLLRAYGIDVVVSGHWWADEAIGRYKAEGGVPQPWVIAMHGCYESVLRFPDDFPGHVEALERAERLCNHWVWSAPKNRELFERGLVAPRGASQILTGYQPGRPGGLRRAEIGVPDDALLFTLAARATVAKGWQVALDALAQVRQAARGRRDVRLLLIGDGPIADTLRTRALPEGVHIAPYTDRLADYIAISDVGLLPSWFEGESLPLVVIEFLAQGRPAIVSDIGLSGWAIDAGDGTAAGIVVPRDGPEGAVSTDRLAAAMARFVADPGLGDALAAAALTAAAKFDMAAMVGNYRALFEELIAVEAGGGTRQSAQRLFAET